MAKRQLKLGAFMRPISIHTGAWRYPGAWPDANFNFDHIKTLIRKLEAGKFDAFFMADHLAVLNMPINALKRNLPNVRAVHVPHTTCGAFMAIVSMRKIAEGEPQMAMMATFGTELYTKQVIVVDEDVDIYSMNDVMWAIATRVRAEKDVLLVPNCKSAILDPTSDPKTFTVTKMGIDATRPTGQDFAERLVISDEQRAHARKLLAQAGVKL